MITACIFAALLASYLGTSSYYVVKEVPVKRTPVVGTPTSEYQDVLFYSRVDDIQLSGWLIPGQRDHAIVIVNGAGQNRVDHDIGTLLLSSNLAKHGFALLLFDLRGRGNSQGKGLFLTHDERDIGGAVDYMRSAGYEKISLLSFSAGAATSLAFASQESLSSMISDSSFTNTGEMLVKKAEFLEPLVRLFSPGFFLMAKLIYGCNRVDPEDIIADVDCPVLFIHGNADENIPVECAYELYGVKANPEDELLVVPNAKHTQSYKVNPEEYITRVVGFLLRDNHTLRSS